jgi:WXG100 family type VII secretion target
MRSGAQELQELNSRFCQSIKSIYEKQQQLSSMWQGDANTAFNAAFQHDAMQWDVFATLINGYAATLMQIAQIYEQAEQQNTSIAASRSYGGGGRLSVAHTEWTLPTIALAYGGPDMINNFDLISKALKDFDFNIVR